MDLPRTFLDGQVIVNKGDITKEAVDAIVNAANGTLMGGGGVDGAIHRAGGREILEECREIRRVRFLDGLPAGQAVITTAGRMPAKHVIHTVGPVYGSGGEAKSQLLAACYANSLALAVENGLSSIAFPAISTGVYGYPMNQAAVVSSSTIEQFLQTERSIEQVRLIFFTSGDAEVFVRHQRFSR
ncbi:MAG TPA: O-acetyl-ADP-ribose deacetylase [Candidatus Binatia bacterium]